MKNMSNTAKFLIVCAVIFALGLVMTIGGCAAGGLDGFRNTLDGNGNAEKPVEEGMLVDEYEFSSIEITGCADFVIAGNRYYKEVLEDNEIFDTEAKPGMVIVKYDKSKEPPEVSTENGRLTVDAAKAESDVLDFGVNLYEPTVIILCGDDELGSIKISSEASDVDIAGVAFRSADVQTNAGEIDMRDVISNGITAVNDAGSTEISGILKGTTEVRNDAGDIDVDTFDDPSSYSMELHTDAGDITVGENDIEGGEYTQKGGENLLKLWTDAGDIEVDKK